MVFEVGELQRKNWVKFEKEWSTRVRQPMKDMCTGVRQLPIEDLCVGVRELQLGVRHLPMEDLCIGVRQLQLQDTIRSPNGWMLFIGARQFSMNNCI